MTKKLNYEPHPTKKKKDGRPWPARPATPEDHHDHRHFPFVEGDCPICDETVVQETLAATKRRKKA